ncbi:NAD-dependent epimerase/dehydratase family protein [Pseudoalteromonas 'SMAR']|uniref:NAD-dependent epimerase/dehydratase family protein n=1 Tax=Pseudoalteromonas 'SMAR' TaxID=3416908 RepID=UPI003AF2C713
MQTILGATGQIGIELAKALKQNHTEDIRLVSRNPVKVNDSDTLFAADLTCYDETLAAVAGSAVVYFTAGLPLDTKTWQTQFPQMVENVIAVCQEHGTKLVFFDNTYMYPQTAVPMTEATAFQPYGKKGQVRAQLAQQVLAAIESGRVSAMICRAPEFYGPGKTQSITNATVLEKLAAGEPAKVFLRDDVVRSLIYTPDASRAMALLGNTAEAYNQTWHLPCDDNRMSYGALIDLCRQLTGQDYRYRVIKKWQLQLLAIWRPQIRETLELLPRYQVDNIFLADKFKARFPDFAITPFAEGIKKVLTETR